MKMYNEDMKYGGLPTESLTLKFGIFTDLSSKAGLPKEGLATGFSSMLKGTALQHYYSSCHGHGFDIRQLLNRFENHFEGEEHRRNMLREWNSVSLRSEWSKDPNKPKAKLFNDMVERLRLIQQGLDPEYRSDSALRNKIVQTVTDIAACSTATLVPTSSISGLVNNIHSAIENSELAAKAENHSHLDSSVYLTDRRYRNSAGQDRRPLDRGQTTGRRFSDRNHDQGYDRPYNRPRYPQRDLKRCFICKKPGCWSTEHPEKERNDYKERFIKATDSYLKEQVDLDVPEDEESDEEEQLRQWIVPWI